jgi:hypothetical protein
MDKFLEELRAKMRVQKVILITVDAAGVGVGTLGFVNRCEALGAFEAAKCAYYDVTNQGPLIQAPQNKEIQ